MKKRDKFEVVDFASGDGWFVHGGNLNQMHIVKKEDAEQICTALNMMERLKLNSTKRKIEVLAVEIQALKEALENGTEYEY